LKEKTRTITAVAIALLVAIVASFMIKERE
jgi:hypothetical protein